MAFDFKKEYKEFYLPPQKPQIMDLPAMNYIAVQGQGDPNEEGGAYQQAVGVLYAVAYTIKMSYKGSHKIEGFFEYVVPPLEGFWWQEGREGIDPRDKAAFRWISVIRSGRRELHKQVRLPLDLRDPPARLRYSGGLPVGGRRGLPKEKDGLLLRPVPLPHRGAVCSDAAHRSLRHRTGLCGPDG